jgi:hypothetical protein
VVGRVAFWTDDETCKLNLNTAGEGVFHDYPAADTFVERRYARQVPVAGQYGWHAAHPAFTSLSPVLRRWGNGGLWMPRTEAMEEPESLWRRYVDLYQGLLPHGWVTGDREPRKGRHFAVVDDLLGAAERSGRSLEVPNALTAADLERSRFFLTARSSSPDLNPLGLPKIALWMPPADRTARSLQDRRVLAACTVGSREFAFQRASLAAGGSSQKMSADWLPPNQELYQWLCGLAARPVPGFRDTLQSGMGARNRNQLVLSMIDLLRWGTLAGAGLSTDFSAVRR